MTAAECMAEIEEVLLKSGTPPHALTSRPSYQRDRDDVQRLMVVREIEAIVERYRVYGEEPRR